MKQIFTTSLLVMSLPLASMAIAQDDGPDAKDRDMDNRTYCEKDD